MNKNNPITPFKGLSERDVLNNRQQFGANELPSSKDKSLWLIAWEVVKEPMFLLLVACAVLYLLLGSAKEGLILMSQVLIVIGITFYQERKTEKALSAIRDLTSPRALVIRDGNDVRIAGAEVVVGDIIVLQEGDRIPADAKVLKNINLSIDESLLTGESIAVHKSIWKEGIENSHIGGDETPFVYSGTMIVQGHGWAVVTATGTQTEIGKIGKSLENVVEEKTHLQTEIKQIVKVFGIVGTILFVVAVISFGLLRGEWLQGLLAALAIAMSMLPEEFPVVLTVFMALGAWRMSRKNVLARRVATIETLGSATVLCTDKTGTITQNKMHVEQLYANDENWLSNKETLPDNFHELIEIAILAGQKDPFDPMEKAILQLGTDKLVGTEHLHVDWKLEKEYPLSKDLLAMSRVFFDPILKHHIIASKGAPEAILELCHAGSDTKKELLKVVAASAKDGLRILGVAKAELKGKTPISDLPNDQKDYKFKFLGFVAMSDPIREEVPQAIQECYTAGIRVIMITGDYAETAQNIARQIGLKNHEIALSGKEMADMTDEILSQKLLTEGVVKTNDTSKTSQTKEINLFYRVAPEQKLRLVNALKANNEVVAMTGDGVNDAPALKSAHIGIAMGEKGTDVARETASLVLLDDNFASIVSAIKMGRRIFDNLQNAMVYIFAIHIPIVTMSIVPMLTNFLPLMLLPIHIAFMELVIDPACSIVFEAEAANTDIMKRPPRPLTERFFSFRKIRLGIFLGISAAVTAMGVYGFGLHEHYDEMTMRGMVFTTLLISNLSLILTNLSRRSTILETIFTVKNPTVIWVIAGVLSLVFSMVYIPVIADLFKIEQLSLSDFLIAFLAGMVSIAWFEILKTRAFFIKIEDK